MYTVPRCDSRSASPGSLCSFKSENSSNNISIASDISSILGPEREQVRDNEKRKKERSGKIGKDENLIFEIR